ncbi:hypothetical protein GN956_G7633 [Arapaima gigas]
MAQKMDWLRKLWVKDNKLIVGDSSSLVSGRELAECDASRDTRQRMEETTPLGLIHRETYQEMPLCPLADCSTQSGVRPTLTSYDDSIVVIFTWLHQVWLLT